MLTGERDVRFSVRMSPGNGRAVLDENHKRQARRRQKSDDLWAYAHSMSIASHEKART